MILKTRPGSKTAIPINSAAKSKKSSLKIFLRSRHDACVNRFLLGIILLFICVFGVRAEDERIFIDAKINGKPVQFAFDTGTGPPVVLFSTAARRLGLKVTPPNYQPGPGKAVAGTTELCDLDLGITKARTSLYVVDEPTYLNAISSADGVLGWQLLKNNVFILDAVKHKLKLCKVPKDATAWTTFRLLTNLDVLGFEVPDQKGAKTTVFIDTGSADGVSLNPQMWREWKVTHTNQPITINAYYNPVIGVVVEEEAWTHDIAFGPLVLTDVPVMQADSNEVALDTSRQTQYEASLGLTALKRLDIIIDGKHGIAYLRSKKTPPLPYEHNRLGANFVPATSQSDELVAKVADGSPAQEAGIQNGDVLLKLDELDVSISDINILRKFWMPPGTKVNFTLKRGDRIFKTTAVLRNILPPDAPKRLN